MAYSKTGVCFICFSHAHSALDNHFEFTLCYRSAQSGSQHGGRNKNIVMITTKGVRAYLSGLRCIIGVQWRGVQDRLSRAVAGVGECAVDGLLVAAAAIRNNDMVQNNGATSTMLAHSNERIGLQQRNNETGEQHTLVIANLREQLEAKNLALEESHSKVLEKDAQLQSTRRRMLARSVALVKSRNAWNKKLDRLTQDATEKDATIAQMEEDYQSLTRCNNRLQSEITESKNAMSDAKLMIADQAAMLKDSQKRQRNMFNKVV